jgi:hypothetical protein
VRRQRLPQRLPLPLPQRPQGQRYGLARQREQPPPPQQQPQQLAAANSHANTEVEQTTELS